MNQWLIKSPKDVLEHFLYLKPPCWSPSWFKKFSASEFNNVYILVKLFMGSWLQPFLSCIFWSSSISRFFMVYPIWNFTAFYKSSRARSGFLFKFSIAKLFFSWLIVFFRLIIVVTSLFEYLEIRDTSDTSGMASKNESSCFSSSSCPFSSSSFSA